MFRYLILFTLYSLCFPASLWGDTAVQIIMTKRAAVSISPIRLYADSSFAKPTETTFTEGEVFEIIGETQREHLDNTQNQTFKWFKARNTSGIVGWLFGDNLAVILPEYLVDAALRPYYKKPIKLDAGFEKTTIWLAGTEGHDIKSDTDAAQNPLYKEAYLVLTNERGKSLFLNTSNANESVRKDVQSIYFQDLTENRVPEIIIETASLSAGRAQEERQLEIYSLKSGGLVKIFEERLTLDWANGVSSPSLSKFVEIEGSIIRIAYIDYLPCENYTLSFKTDIRSQTQERCLEYVTYSFIWDSSKKQFQNLYKPSRRSVQAIPVRMSALVQIPSFMTIPPPSVSQPNATPVEPTDRLQVIKHFENLRVEKNKKWIETWLYVKHPSGIYGYLPAQDLQFLNCEHAPILQTYYQKTPLMKQDWRSDMRFVSMH
jgi:hypothetical protein